MEIGKCDVCGKLAAALHVCRLCERRVCEEHFKPQEGICSSCYSRSNLATRDTEEALTASVPFKLFLLGFSLMFVGMIVLFVAAALQGEGTASGALVIFVGPIPVILAAGPHASLALLIAFILTIIGFAVFFWLRKIRV